MPSTKTQVERLRCKPCSDYGDSSLAVCYEGRLTWRTNAFRNVPRSSGMLLLQLRGGRCGVREEASTDGCLPIHSLLEPCLHLPPKTLQDNFAAATTPKSGPHDRELSLKGSESTLEHRFPVREVPGRREAQNTESAHKHSRNTRGRGCRQQWAFGSHFGAGNLGTFRFFTDAKCIWFHSCVLMTLWRDTAIIDFRLFGSVCLPHSGKRQQAWFIFLNYFGRFSLIGKLFEYYVYFSFPLSETGLLRTPNNY